MTKYVPGSPFDKLAAHRPAGSVLNRAAFGEPSHSNCKVASANGSPASSVRTQTMSTGSPVRQILSPLGGKFVSTNDNRVAIRSRGSGAAVWEPGVSVDTTARSASSTFSKGLTPGIATRVADAPAAPSSETGPLTRPGTKVHRLYPYTYAPAHPSSSDTGNPTQRSQSKAGGITGKLAV